MKKIDEDNQHIIVLILIVLVGTTLGIIIAVSL
jgi:hypothetical protein